MKNINVLELDNYIDLIDIRSSQKYNEGHIPDAKNIPFELLMTKYDELLDKSKIYYVYCQSGIRSITACSKLIRRGYNVVNVIGGYNAWLLNKK